MTTAEIRRGGVIYVTECRVNNKLYVGIHIRGKKNYLGSGLVFINAIKKYGRENFTRTDIDTFDSLEEGFAKEKYWIAKLNSKSPNGYNLCDGGRGSLNPCPESRAKMSAHCSMRRPEVSAKIRGSRNPMKRPEVAAKISGTNSYMFGKKHRPETLAKMSLANAGENNHFFGKHHTAEARAKMSAADRDRIVSEETRRKMSAKRMGHPTSAATRAKIGAAHRGRVHRPEWNAKISATKKGQPWSEARWRAQILRGLQ